MIKFMAPNKCYIRMDIGVTLSKEYTVKISKKDLDKLFEAIAARRIPVDIIPITK